MKRTGLGIEDATKALTVNKALRREMETSQNPEEAIQSLACRISLSTLMYDSGDEDPTCNEQDSSIRPEMRIEPVSTAVERPTPSRTTKPSSIRKPKVNKSLKTKSKAPNKNTTAGRKRSIEEITPVEKKLDSSIVPTTRGRANSVSEQVDAKMCAQKSSDEGASSESSTMRPQASVRAKRVLRGDESESNTPATSHKRIRGSEG
jgi:hypothetical protein